MNPVLATPDDCDQIALIYNAYLGVSTMDLEQKDGQYYRDFLDHKNAREELWVMRDNKKTVVWGIIKKYSDREGYRTTVETSVYCHVEYLRRGLGTKMKKHIMQRCKNLGYHHLIAKIQSDNEVSIHYNLRLGYTIVGEQKEVGIVNGQWKNVTIMQYLFS